MPFLALRQRILQTVERAAHALAATVENVRVDHRRADVLVAEQLLDGADAVAALEQMRREGVAQRVARGVLGDAGTPHGVADGALDDGGVHVMAALLPGAVVGPAALLREDPLPAPLRRCARVLAGEGVGELNAVPA